MVGVMKLRHSNRALNQEGKRILALLKEQHILDKADLRAVSDIVDEYESVCLGILALYGTILAALLATLFVLELATGFRNEGLNGGLIGAVFSAFCAHFLWEFRCDNYRKQISKRLRCKKCSHKLPDGLGIRLFARSGVCPSCGCGRATFFRGNPQP